MPLDNFLVRAKRRLVERSSDQKVWDHLRVAEDIELVREVAALPSALMDSDQEGKNVDTYLAGLATDHVAGRAPLRGVKKGRDRHCKRTRMEKPGIPMGAQ